MQSGFDFAVQMGRDTFHADYAAGYEAGYLEAIEDVHARLLHITHTKPESKCIGCEAADAVDELLEPPKRKYSKSGQ